MRNQQFEPCRPRVTNMYQHLTNWQKYANYSRYVMIACFYPWKEVVTELEVEGILKDIRK